MQSLEPGNNLILRAGESDRKVIEIEDVGNTKRSKPLADERERESNGPAVVSGPVWPYFLGFINDEHETIIGQ